MRLILFVFLSIVMRWSGTNTVSSLKKNPNKFHNQIPCPLAPSFPVDENPFSQSGEFPAYNVARNALKSLPIRSMALVCLTWCHSRAFAVPPINWF
uniref:Putative secreted peptide n=1 Tax=Anopheles braziliensis TaxID=58242 RepID=A0A2M3ZW47_9DIPT